MRTIAPGHRLQQIQRTTGRIRPYNVRQCKPPRPSRDSPLPIQSRRSMPNSDVRTRGALRAGRSLRAHRRVTLVLSRLAARTWGTAPGPGGGRHPALTIYSCGGHRIFGVYNLAELKTMLRTVNPPSRSDSGLAHRPLTTRFFLPHDEPRIADDIFNRRSRYGVLTT